LATLLPAGHCPPCLDGSAPYGGDSYRYQDLDKGRSKLGLGSLGKASKCIRTKGAGAGPKKGNKAGEGLEEHAL